jgi:hypothetical protein
MALLELRQALLIERRRPGKHRSVDAIRGEVKEIFRAGGVPDFRTNPACRPQSLALGPLGSVFRPAFEECRAWGNAAKAVSGRLPRPREKSVSFTASLLLANQVWKVFFVFADGFD